MNKTKWKNLGLDFAKKMGKKCIGIYAGSATFFFLMSLIPTIMVLVSIITMTTLTEDDVVMMVNAILPDFADGVVNSLIDQAFSGSVSLLSFSILFIIWAGATGMMSMIRGLNIMDEVEDDVTYFIKEKNGFGSMGARRIKGSDIKRIDSSLLDRIVVQEDCTGKGSRADKLEEVTAECFYDGIDCSIAIRERLEAKSGVCTKARFLKIPEVEKVIKRFTELLPFPPVFNIQFVHRDDEWLVMDVNLRLAAGTGLSAAAGFDTVRALLAWILGEQIDPSWLTVDESVKTVLRVYKEVTVR